MPKRALKLMYVMPMHGHRRLSFLQNMDICEMDDFRIFHDTESKMIEEIKMRAISLIYHVVLFDFFNHLHDNVDMARKLKWSLNQFALVAVINGGISSIQYKDGIIYAPINSEIERLSQAARNLDALNQMIFIDEV